MQLHKALKLSAKRSASPSERLMADDQLAVNHFQSDSKSIQLGPDRGFNPLVITWSTFGSFL
jgi:hypothetical protein